MQTMLITKLERRLRRVTVKGMRFVSWVGLATSVGLTALGCGQADNSPPVEPGHTDVDATGNEDTEDKDTGDEVNSTTSTSDAGSTSTDTTSAEPRRCQPGPGTTGSPSSVVEVVELINGLPHPVTMPCFLEALDRPLSIMAAASFISAQPAFNVDNPRIFILVNGLSLSVVPYGDSSTLLEMGEFVSPTRSIKAELEFPIEEPLGLDAAFQHIRSDVYGGTVCFGCHHGEEEEVNYPVPGAFSSVAYRPFPEYEVNFDYVKYQFTTCDPVEQPERCAFYRALFGHGEVSSDRFSEEVPLFQ